MTECKGLKFNCFFYCGTFQESIICKNNHGWEFPLDQFWLQNNHAYSFQL